MVASARIFTTLQKFLIKNRDFTHVCSFRRNFKVMSNSLNARVMQDFTVRNVQDEERLQICFNYGMDGKKDRLFNMDRFKAEDVSVTLTRLCANVEKHFFKKKKKKSKGDSTENSEAEVCPVNVNLCQNGQKVIMSYISHSCTRPLSIKSVSHLMELKWSSLLSVSHHIFHIVFSILSHSDLTSEFDRTILFLTMKRCLCFMYIIPSFSSRFLMTPQMMQHGSTVLNSPSMRLYTK